ncbi:unnamed protein product [Paramecium pentaurelia]|uniref:non-specific serine/threonine protein kinase n=1 Tax=Paramecium pentaurelia TaxID=43138 RepID=A0A8S1Y036_9CILI|nr:unnamed protein product [Paramecium pentaurelia]
MGNGQCQQTNQKSEVNKIITEENVHSDESDHNLTSKITDRVYKVNFARNELIWRLQSINQETQNFLNITKNSLLYVTELILSLNKYTIQQLKTMIIGAHKTYQILIEAIIKMKPENNEIVPVLSEEYNNFKLFYELQAQPAQQLYYRPVYNEDFEIIREIRVKRIRNYVIKEDNITDIQKTQQRLQYWIQLSQKNHPNLLNLRAAVIQKNICKYVTDYIDGITLDKFQNKYIQNQDKIKIMQQMIDALKMLHSQQLVHGDIKPSNFMVTLQQQIILLDLDQLGAERQSADMTYLYSFKNEQCPTFQGDVWSLGLCIYSLFFGQRIEKNWTIEDYKRRDFPAFNIRSYEPIQQILDACIIDSPKDIWYISTLSKQY